MKTAREQLYDETVALLEKPVDDTSIGVMRKIMARYRVQTKPGIDIPAGITARDALGDRLVDIWRSGGADDATRARIGTAIDEFRMQLKQAGGGGDKPAAPRPPRPVPAAAPSRAATSADPPARASSATKPPSSNPGPSSSARPFAAPSSPAPMPRPNGVRPTPPTVQLGVADPPVRMPRGPEPVAGGPRTRKKARGECPKCKSKGVVLARSYAGDEYYSCIYCGWQAYKAVEEDDPNASLAARLLGQTAGPE